MYNKEILKTTIDKTTGYFYFLDKEHPLATGNANRVLLHRHIMSLHLGRWINTSEIVHHIDYNKLNNNIENLQILSATEHGKLHVLESGRNTCQSVCCKGCGNIFKQRVVLQEYCSKDCANVSFVKNTTVTKEVLDELIPNNTWTALGKMFGYSDVGIKKRAKALGCEVPVRRKTNKGVA